MGNRKLVEESSQAATDTPGQGVLERMGAGVFQSAPAMKVLYWRNARARRRRPR